MPRKGFKSITISEDLYWKLVEKATVLGISPHELIRQLLEGADRTTIDDLSDVGLNTLLHREEQRNALKVEIDETDHIIFKCAHCGSELILFRIEHNPSRTDLYFLCPSCWTVIYTKHNNPATPLEVWQRIAKAKEDSPNKTEEQLVYTIVRDRANDIAKIIVKSAIAALKGYDYIGYSNSYFEIPLNINEQFKAVFYDIESNAEFDFKFIPYYSKCIGEVFKFENMKLKVPEHVFAEVLVDLLLNNILKDLSPKSAGQYALYTFNWRYIPRELLFPVTYNTDNGPQRYKPLKALTNLYREYRFHWGIKDELSRIDTLLQQVGKFKKIDMNTFSKIFGGRFDAPEYIRAYLKLIDWGIIFIEFRDEVYILLHRNWLKKNKF